MAMGVRRAGRIVALQVLYEWEATRHRAEEVLARQVAEHRLSEQGAAFAGELVQGVLSHLAEIDQQIEQAASREGSLEQMAKIDKTILRLAIFEILYNNTVPVKGAMNEAVELAKLFGSEHSGPFVNGVLGTISSLGQSMPRPDSSRSNAQQSKRKRPEA
jgi:N utilization substance protein B